MVRLSYFAAQEIPAALVTYVSLLMFLQTGTSAALSTLYSALLSLPWVMKGALQRWTQSSPRVHRACQRRWLNPLLLSEVILVADFLLMALSLSPNNRLFRLFGMGGEGSVGLLAMLLVLSLATAVHEVLADTCYHTQLRPHLRRLYDLPRLVVSQLAVAGTYGILIILVGTLQVLSRSIFVSWSGASLLMAGVMFLFVVWHVCGGGESRQEADRAPEAMPPYLRQPEGEPAAAPTVHILPAVLCTLFFLPQALMFFSRVLFLLAPREAGGLSRSLQEVGFVHGVVGALAFSLGIALSRILVRRRMSRASVARRKVRYSQYSLPPHPDGLLRSLDLRMLLRFLPLLLSPLVYCLMSWQPPRTLWQLALCTFTAQFLFGYGMHRLLSFLGLPASIGLRVPMVAGCMLVPMALSGWLVVQMGFRHFYVLDVLCGLLPVLTVLLLALRRRKGYGEKESLARKAVHRGVCILAFLFLGGDGYAQLDSQLFRKVDIQDGLSDNSVQHILQLPDGRMVITTRKCINVYDGYNFRYISPSERAKQELPAYCGAYHVYADAHNLLWVKDFQHVCCFDLRHFSYVENMDSVFSSRGAKDIVQDLFVDSKRHLWLVTASGQIRRADGVPLEINLPVDKGPLQDMDETDEGIFLFFSNSTVVCYDALTGRKRYESMALQPDEAGLYASSSLVVKDNSGKFYQLRDGDGGGICLTFNAATQQWKELFRSTEILHTLCLAPSSSGTSVQHAYVTSETKMRQIDLTSLQVSEISQINLDGKSISSERMNTVFCDSQGGLWLGSYNDGLLYSHPALVDDAFIPQTLCPILTDVTVCGMKLHCGDERMPMSEAYTHELTFPSSQNTLLLEYAALNYPVPLATIYYYKVFEDGEDEDSVPWVEATYGNGAVGKDGILHIQLENLKPARHHLVVRAGSNTDSDVYRLIINIESPWWAGIPAIATFFFIFLLLAAILSYLIHRRYRRGMKMKYEEKILLTRLQTLIERFDMEASVADGALDEANADDEADEFVRKAVKLVEKNIGVRGYNVEQLSRDMCMERTGLYKRMTELMDKTPSLFIRSIRLQKAASLLMKGDLSVTEVAEQTGFSSSSHMSRCFQAEWGCTPMEYVRKHSSQQQQN